ncbi:MAG: hypothetical protein AB7Q37_01815 [Pyrinomonadaceae bacterium]
MRITITLALVAGTSIGLAAQSIYTPARGSAERKAILDALRVPVERDLKQKIVFSAENFNVMGTWAFIGGEPQRSGGSRPDYRGTRYWDAVLDEMFDNNIFALMRKTGGRWRVVTYAIGCTDVCYADWWRRYRAPKAIFPYTE